MVKITLLTFFALMYFKLFQCKKYHNHTLLRGMPTDMRQLEFLQNLSETYHVNFWRPPGLVNMPVDFTVGPEDRPTLQSEAGKRGIHLNTIIPDVQSAFDKQTVKAYIRRNLASFDWQNYYGLDDIYSWLRDLKKVYSSEMKIRKIGRTWERRNILAVIVTLKGCKFRSTVIVEGGIHAREWISPAVATYMLQEILRAPKSNDSSLREIALTYKWVFMPVVNPDGYEYSHSDDRLWRKNRRNPNAVDLNRNFDIMFGSIGVSRKGTSEIYCGMNPFSERETKAMSDLIKENGPELEYYISLHSYGQYMIIPYAYETSHLHNYDEVRKMIEKARNSLYRKYGTSYAYGTAQNTVGYRTSGSSADWVKLTFRVPYVVTFELRDKGSWGFALPPQEILPTCKETMDGVLTFLRPSSDQAKKLDIDYGNNKDHRTSFETLVLACNCLLFIIIRFY